jgi:predicted RNase H-like nuclease (RuvC/YqgF family)
MDAEVQIREQRERIERLEALVKTQVEMIEKLRAQLEERNSSQQLSFYESRWDSPLCSFVNSESVLKVVVVNQAGVD